MIDAALSGSSGLSFHASLTEQASGLLKGERTKAAIEASTCKCLDRLSLTDLTIADIATEARISHGTFYIYFQNRDALVSDLLFRFVDFIQLKMHQASQQALENSARAATAAYTYLFEQNLGLMKCLLRYPEEFPEARLAFQKLNREWLEAVVAARKADIQRSGGTVDQAELMRRAYALGGMVDQYLAGLLLDKDPNMASFSENREDIIETFNALWEQGLRL